MRKSVNTKSLLISLVVGVVVGTIGGPAFMLLPWAIIAGIIGWNSAGKRVAVLNGAAYGFALAFVFTLTEYHAPVAPKLFMMLALGLVGAIFALIWSFVGKLVHREFDE